MGAAAAAAAALLRQRLSVAKVKGFGTVTQSTRSHLGGRGASFTRGDMSAVSEIGQRSGSRKEASIDEYSPTVFFTASRRDLDWRGAVVWDRSPSFEASNLGSLFDDAASLFEFSGRSCGSCVSSSSPMVSFFSWIGTPNSWSKAEKEKKGLSSSSSS